MEFEKEHSAQSYYGYRTNTYAMFYRKRCIPQRMYICGRSFYNFHDWRPRISRFKKIQTQQYKE